MTMFSKKLLLPTALVAAASAPYIMDQDWSGTTADMINAVLPEPEETTPNVTGTGYDAAHEVAMRTTPSEYEYGAKSQIPQDEPLQNLAGPPVADFGEVLRFDIDPRWVTTRWPRITTTLSEANLQGLRVPLVTGTKTDDMAGSLTYYFDQSHQVQRIAFEGYTGDERRLAWFLNQYYQMQSEPTLHAGMYVGRWNGVPFSVLRVARAPVMTSESPNSQLHLLLELNRPGRTVGLSARVAQMLDQDRQAVRW